MNDFASLATKLDRLSAQLTGEAQKELVSAVAFDAKKDAMKEMVVDLGGDKKFSNWKPRLNAGYDFVSDHAVELKGRPFGPWLVLDQGRSPGSKYSRKRKREVSWSRSKGKHSWSRAVEVMERETPHRVQRELHKQLLRIFTGS
ncbi:MAG: hypothetical protein ABL953_04520 [Ilumatobacteraceae bacterium]